MAILANLLVKIGVDADRVDEGLNRVGGFFEKHGAKLAAAGGAIGAAGGVALVQGLQAGMEKEALGDKLAAQLGATGPEAARLGKIAGNVYSQGLGEGLDQVHDAVGAVVSSIDGMRGASNEAVQDMTGKALNLAKAFEIDVARSAQVVGQIVKSGLVKDANQGMDLLTASLQKVPAAVREDLVDALDEYAPFMQQIGIKGQTAFNLLVQSAEKGAFGLDKTGDALKEFTLRATDMSASSKTAYDAIGLSQKKMTADLLAGGDRGAEAFQKIVKGLQGIKDPTERSQAALALFGTPLEDLSTQDIPKFLASLDTTKNTLGDTAGAADRFGQTLNDNAQTGIAEWQRKTDAAMSSLVNANGIMGDTAQAATGITQSLAPIGSSLGGIALTALVAGKSVKGIGSATVTGFKKVGGAVKGAGSRLGGFASRAGTAAAGAGRGIGTAAGKIGSAAGRIAAATGRVAVSAAKMAAQVAVAAGRVALSFTMAAARAVAAAARMVASMAMTVVRVVAGWVIMGVQALLGAARVALAWLIAMGPVGIVIAIIIGLVALVIIFWDKIKAAIAAGWNWIKGKTSAVWNAILNFIKKNWMFILAVILGPLGLIVALIIKNWDKVKGFTSAAWNAIVNFLKNAWNRAKSAVTSGISRVVGLARSLPGRIRSAIGNLGRLLVNAGRNVVNGLINGITSRFGALANKAREMASKIRNVLPFSPAKEGPLSGRGSPERAGRKIGAMVASGMDRSTGHVAAAAAGMASAASVTGAAAAMNMSTAATPAGVRAAGAAGGGPVLTIRSGGSKFDDLLVEVLRAAVAERGGDVQKTLGRR